MRTDRLAGAGPGPRDEEIVDERAAPWDGFRLLGGLCGGLFFLAFLFFLFHGGRFAEGVAAAPEPEVDSFRAGGAETIGERNWQHFERDLEDAGEFVTRAIDRETPATYFQTFYQNLRGLTVASTESLPADWAHESRETLERLRATWLRLYGPAKLRELEARLRHLSPGSRRVAEDPERDRLDTILPTEGGTGRVGERGSEDEESSP